MPENENTGQGTAGTDKAPEAKPADTTNAQEADVESTEDAAGKLDPKVKDKIERANREAAALRKRIKEEFEPAAKMLKELQDKDKTEGQRLADRLEQLEKQNADYQVREVRTAAATAAGLPAAMIQFITATDADTAQEQAKALLEWRKESPPDLKQGARKTAPSAVTGDDLIRRMAGRQ